MKAIIAVLSVFAVTVQAQTFVRYTLKDWVFSYGQTNVSTTNNYYTNAVSFYIPTNTIFKGTIVVGNAGVGSSPDVRLQAQYPDTTTPVDVGTTGPNGPNQTPIIGPAEVTLSGFLTAYVGANGGTYNSPVTGTIVLLAEFDPVNTSPAIQGFGVQPANSSAAISLETSTDLKMWQTTTNGTYGLTNAARFFRMNLTVTP